VLRPEIVEGLPKLALTIYLVIIIVYDLKTRTIPNWLTLPAIVGVLAWQFCKSALTVQPLWAVLVVLVFWTALLVLWVINLYGGGDAKLLMVLFGLWPRVDFLLVEAGISLLIGIPLLVRKYRGQSWPGATRNFGEALWQGQGGYPWGAVYALGGIVFTWLGI